MRGKHIRGEGMGSILLSQGGSGGASAYQSVQDYQATTGVSHMSGQGLSSLGRSLEKITPKLEGLKISALKRVKPKNISFNFKS
jgi:hypothetical protein